MSNVIVPSLLALRRHPLLWPGLGLLTAGATALAVRATDDVPDSLPLHLCLWLIAGGLWLLALWVGAAAGPTDPKGPAHSRPRWDLFWLLAIAFLLRLPGWLTPPRHSDDYYRYLWDGAVQRAGLNPYLGPPGDPIYAPVRAKAGVEEGIFRHINNPELPTIYPPAAQLALRLGSVVGAHLPHIPEAAGTALAGWKIVVASADLLALWVLVLLCRGAKNPLRGAAAWGWAPACGIELAQDGHIDGIGVLFLLLSLLAVQRGRKGPRNSEGDFREWHWPAAFLSGAFLGVAILVKPIAAAALPPLLLQGFIPGAKPAAWTTQRRRLGPALCLGLGIFAAALLCTLPYAGAGRRIAGSLGEYGRRWRGNDGAFAVLQRGAEVAVKHLYRPPYWRIWRQPRLARLITGRDRDSVWPDELSGFLARAAALVLLAACALWAARARLPPARFCLAVLGAYLLLTPALHPWYVLWALALCPLWPGRAAPWLLLTSLVPLGYVPLAAYLHAQAQHPTPWLDPCWNRVVEHGACIGMLLFQSHASRKGKQRARADLGPPIL